MTTGELIRRQGTRPLRSVDGLAAEGPFASDEEYAGASRQATTSQRHLDSACCLVRELPLATLNTKDYLDFSEHEGLELLP